MLTCTPFRKLPFGLMLVLALTTGCATTDYLAVVDPDYKGAQFGSVLIMSPFRDLRYKALIENVFVKKLESEGVSVYDAMTILPPTRVYTEDEAMKVLQDRGIESILLIGMVGFNTSEEFVEKSSTRAYASSAGYVSRTSHVGGYVTTNKAATFEIRLIDAKNGRTAFLASAGTMGDKYSDLEIMLMSLAGKIVGAIEDGKLFKFK